jgi:hypothetical protein
LPGGARKPMFQKSNLIQVKFTPSHYVFGYNERGILLRFGNSRE